jgi:predicted nucleic acid-binding Zn ribbon protein
MPTYTFKCPLNHLNHVIIPLAERDKVFVECEKCGGPMKRVPAAPAFTIEGYSAKNGYSKKESE